MVWLPSPHCHHRHHHRLRRRRRCHRRRRWPTQTSIQTIGQVKTYDIHVRNTQHAKLFIFVSGRCFNVWLCALLFLSLSLASSLFIFIAIMLSVAVWVCYFFPVFHFLISLWFFFTRFLIHFSTSRLLHSAIENPSNLPFFFSFQCTQNFSTNFFLSLSVVLFCYWEKVRMENSGKEDTQRTRE